MHHVAICDDIVLAFIAACSGPSSVCSKNAKLNPDNVSAGFGHGNMDRDQFITHQTEQADWKFSFTPGETDARERFLRLAINTYDFKMAGAAKACLPFDPWPESAGNALRSGFALSPDLVSRWENWNREYYELRARNPRLELRDLMQEVGESTISCSWPDGYEPIIWAWVEAGNSSIIPRFRPPQGMNYTNGYSD